MFDGIKNYFIKKIVVKGAIGQLEKLFASLPQDDKKTINGILIACVGIVLTTIPETSDFAQPILDYLRTLPAEEIAAGGIVWGGIGLFHKSLKWIIKAAGYQTTKEKSDLKKAIEQVKVVEQAVVEVAKQDAAKEQIYV